MTPLVRLAGLAFVWVSIAVILSTNKEVSADLALVMAFLSTLVLVAPEVLVDRPND